jgi:DNA-binding response OmpR family regulator
MAKGKRSGLIMRILLIEDDLQICEVTRKYFTSKGAEITIINNGSEAVSITKNELEGYSIVLLDIMLPGADGFTICRNLRRFSDIPIIFITARGHEEDILHGYDLGCDDYIVKPFLLSALFAKCSAMVKRNEGCSDSVISCGAIKLDTRKLTCYVDNEEIELTPKEFSILSYLMEHQGWIVNRDTLLDKVWGDDFFGIDRVVDNTIKRIRKKLGNAGSQIHTVIGRGYKLTET